MRKNEIDLEALSKFIAVAKRTTFAEGGNTVASSRLGSEDYFYQEGNFTYRDSFFGSLYDIGQEIVWENSKPVWGMNYMGGMRREYEHLSRKSFEFLKECLKRVEERSPYRGPEEHKDGDLRYLNEVRGDISRFFGEEKIFFKGEEIYTRVYHGGLIL